MEGGPINLMTPDKITMYVKRHYSETKRYVPGFYSVERAISPDYYNFWDYVNEEWLKASKLRERIREMERNFNKWFVSLRLFSMAPKVPRNIEVITTAILTTAQAPKAVIPHYRYFIPAEGYGEKGEGFLSN